MFEEVKELFKNMVWSVVWKGNLGGPRPINTLNGNPSRPTPSRPSQSSPPHSKRQKVQESADVHTEARFALIPQFDGFSDSVVPRKRSASVSICSVSDTHATVSGQSSNNKSNSQNVRELRHVEQYVHPRPKRPRHKDKGQKNKLEREPTAELSRPKDDDTDPLADDDDEVEIVQHHKGATASQQHPRRVPHQGDLPLDNLRSRFKPTARTTPGLYSIKRGTTQKRPFQDPVDHSIDELSMDAEGEDLRPKIPVSRAQPKSSSLSTKGDVSRTQFTGTKMNHQQLQKVPVPAERDRAAKIIGPGLRIERAVDGPHGYCREANGPCVLSAREISSILHPTDHHGNILGGYSYLTINLRKAHQITVAKNPECAIVSLVRPADLLASAGAKLYVEFSSSSDVDKFVAWAGMPRDGLQPFRIQRKPGEALEKELKNCFRDVTRSTVLRDDGPTPEDIRLIEHNARIRQQGDEATTSTQHRPQAPPRRRLKDQMQPAVSPTSRDSAYEVPESPPQAREPESRELRPARTTRSMFVPKDPTPEPELPSWTESNPNWEKGWRNSLIFPSHGKSRATVDKDDIERLNEGQFLNDNIIIFYLRYLQHTLETEMPDQARRIYFQNTFFFDKLKPTKASGGINYDSVKSWTSRVDLFMKDYIVVPINEYSHWYVAIIYNAPKLIPSETEASDTHNPPRSSIVIEDDRNTAQAEATPETSDQAENIPIVQGDVEAGMSRMSIDSPDMENEAKRTDDNHNQAPQETAESAKDNTINLTHEPEDTSPEIEQTQVLANLSRKRPGKRPSGGPRRYDPDQPRIITLDSLGGSHSPACNYLKQYMVAELKDKKGIEIPIPGALGMTAKNIPLQTNYCDCGLYLLGYIQEFLKDPDKFVRSILQHEHIAWELDPSTLRNRIRDVIFNLQEQQQEKEDALKEEKRRAAALRRAKNSRPSSSEGPKENKLPAQPRREAEAEPRPTQEVLESRPPQGTKSEAASVAPKKTADISSFFRKDDKKTKSTEGNSTSRSNNVEELVVVAKQGSSSTSGPEEQNLPPSLEAPSRKVPPREPDSGRVPGSFPASPQKAGIRSPIEIPSQDTLQSPGADSTDDSGRKLLSPLKSTPPRNSLHKPMLSIERDPEPDDLRRAQESPKKPTIGVHSGSPRRYRRTHSEPHASISPRQENITSRHFAGRQEGDTKVRAKCTPKAVQNNEIVELSD